MTISCRMMFKQATVLSVCAILLSAASVYAADIVGLDTTAGANWRTAANFDSNGGTEYGSDGYIVYGLNRANGVYDNPYTLALGTTYDQSHLPAYITGITRTVTPMWSGNGNFGTMQDPDNGNTPTPVPLLANGTDPQTYTIQRTAGAGFRLTVLVASGDGGNVTHVTTCQDHVDQETQTAAHPADGLHYHVYDVEAGSGDVTVTVNDIQRAYHITGLAFDPPPAPPGSPVLSLPTVTNITTTTALGGVTLAGANADVTLFWGTSNEGEAFTWDETNALPAEQTIGTINGVAISSLTVDTTYYYIFYASNGVGGATDWSALNQSFGSGLTGKSVTDLAAATVNATEIDLTRTDNFNAETGYVIQRSPDGLPPWATITATAAGASSYSDTGLSGSSTYHYQIAATNASGLSDWSTPDQATTPARPNQIDTDFTEATFGAVGILRDIPNSGLASITLDAGNDRLVFATTGNTDMWGTRNNAPIGYILKPGGPLWFMEAEIELATTGNQQVFGLTVYEDTDGAKPDFSYGLDYWNPVTPMINLQGLGDNDPLTNVTAVGTTRVILRMEVEDDGGGAGIARYTCKYDLLLGAGMQTLTTYDTSFSNARVGLALKSVAARTAYVHNLEIDDVPAGQPILSAQTVTNITTTTALGGVTLAGANADLTLFWGTSDEGEAFTWDETNALPGEQSIGSISGVAISGLTVDTEYFYIFYASNSVGGLTDWSLVNQSFASALNGLSISDLSASAASAFEIDLTWTDSFSTETGYVVQRSPDGNPPWVTLSTTAAGASTYADLPVLAENTYHYRVAATNAAGLSDWSNVPQATTPAGTSNPNAPAHWWKLDEASGLTALDAGVVGGMHGTILGTSSTRVTPANSRVGNGLDVSAGWSYVNAGNVPVTGSFSANIWIDPNNVNDDWRGLIGKWSVGGQRAFWLGQRNTDGGHLRFGLSFNGSGEVALDTPSGVIGNHCWQMITAIWDETTKEHKLYVNGVLKASAVRAGQTMTTPRSSPLAIMALNDNANQFYGTADDVRLYNRVLTDDEIRALYANPGVEAPELTIMAEDTFDGPALETGWTLDDREAADAHDLTARSGWLRVAVEANANTWLNARDGAAMLYTDAPNGSFTLETRIDIATGNGGSPVGRSSGGLIVHDPSYVTAQYPFAMYFWLGHNGTTTALSLQKPGGNLATAITGVSTHMHLRLYRDAENGTWVASYKVNAGDAWTEWVTVTDGNLPNADVSDTDIYVGIMTKTFAANPANIDYEYFDIPEVSAPTGTLFIVQ